MDHILNIMRSTLNTEIIEGEIWKDIIDYKGFYQVSSLGRVKRLKRSADNFSVFYSLNEKIVKLSKNGNGYLIANLFNKRFLVHRLVAEAFLDQDNGRDIVNHKNGIKDDNRAINLEWSNPSHNMNHAYKNFLKVSEKGQKHGRAKLSDAEVIEIRKSLKNEKELADFYNVSVSTINGIRLGRTWKHLDTDF